MSADRTKVTPPEKFRGETDEETTEAREMMEKARNFLGAFRWCRSIKRGQIGFAYPGIVGVFLFDIEPARPDVDDEVWIVVGDLPPAYITTDDAPNPASALEGYIGAMREWVSAVQGGRSVDGLIPVSAPATPENAKQLDNRLRFLDSEILSRYKADLDAGPGRFRGPLRRRLQRRVSVGHVTPPRVLYRNRRYRIGTIVGAVVSGFRGLCG